MANQDNRFFNRPPIPRQQQKKRQEELQQAVKSEADTAPGESDETALSTPNSACSSSPTHLTPFDRLVESFAPSVRAQFLPEGQQTQEADGRRYFSLADLWESFREWSVYGVGVPVALAGGEPITQYYGPLLSGIQLYIDPQTMRRKHGDVESSKEQSSSGSSDCEAERKAKGSDDVSRSQESLNLERLSVRDKEKPPPKAKSCSSSDEADVGSSSSDNGQLVYEYLEKEQPHNRKPLFDKASDLASEFPELNKYRSSDLLPDSWICVAWYPIYRIPVGPTLQNQDACFLTFHSLSTHSTKEETEAEEADSSGREVDESSKSKICVPVFALDSYKLRGSMLMPNSPEEWQQRDSLSQAAEDWLRRLQVKLPDHEFFYQRS